MALPFSEDFSPSETPMTTHWTSTPSSSYWNNSGVNASGTGARPAGGDVSNYGSYIDDETFAANQYGKFTVKNYSRYARGVILRFVTSGNTGDCIIAWLRTSNRVYVQYVDASAGTNTSLNASAYETQSFADDDVITAEISGANPATVTWKKGTSSWGSYTWETNECDDAGPVGIYCWDFPNNSVDLMADFEAGDLGGGATPLSYSNINDSVSILDTVIGQHNLRAIMGDNLEN